MSEYMYDGQCLRSREGQKLAEIDRSFVRGWNAALLGQIDKRNIRDPRGKKLLEFDGKHVRDDRGKKIISISEIQKMIEGEPGIDMAALWYFGIRNRQANMT